MSIREKIIMIPQVAGDNQHDGGELLDHRHVVTLLVGVEDGDIRCGWEDKQYIRRTKDASTHDNGKREMVSLLDIMFISLSGSSYRLFSPRFRCDV